MGVHKTERRAAHTNDGKETTATAYMYDNANKIILVIKNTSYCIYIYYTILIFFSSLNILANYLLLIH